MSGYVLTREGFVERYGRYFGTRRIETIRKLAFLSIEKRKFTASWYSGSWAALRPQFHEKEKRP